MTIREMRSLVDLDKAIDTSPGTLTPEQLRQYRTLLIKYTSQLTASRMMTPCRIPTFFAPEARGRLTLA